MEACAGEVEALAGAGGVGAGDCGGGGGIVAGCVAGCLSGDCGGWGRSCGCDGRVGLVGLRGGGGWRLVAVELLVGLWVVLLDDRGVEDRGGAVGVRGMDLFLVVEGIVLGG